ncbi:LysM peptidoglycan-binding domain-containing protein [Enterococcus sp. DIV1420a]|uniref:LysM peptidoglycan-binding domain-containing protein n=1 Tax=Enterococcus sp. DIV1420a TaxID=2774672 RepID=UPI003F29338C
MKKAHFQANIRANEPKYRAKMYKKGKKWIIKGLLFSSLVLGGLILTDTEPVHAAEWTANSVESIQAKLSANQSSYTFEEGDTFYNISLAVNVKWQKLMELNGFEDGSQYHVPVGTTISFDGSHIKVTNQQGEIVKEAQLTPADKVDPSATFANQTSDLPKTAVSSTPSLPISNGADKLSTSNDQQGADLTQAKVDAPTTLADKKQALLEMQAELAALVQKQEALEQEKQELELRLTKDVNQANSVKAAELTQQQSDLTQQVKQLQEELSLQKNHLLETNNQLTTAQQEKENLATQLATAEQAWQVTQQKVTNLTTGKQALTVQLENLSEEQVDQRSALTDKLMAIQAELEATTANATQLNELQEQVVQATNTVTELTKQQAEQQTHITDLQARLEQAQKQLNSLAVPTTSQANNAQAAADTATQLANDEKKLNELTNQITTLKANISQLTQTINALEEHISEAQANFQALKVTVNKQDDANQLLLAKEAAKTAIIATDLSNEEKANLLAQVDSATTLDTVAAVQTKATEAKDAETKLNDAKAAAKDQINALTDLAEADKNTLLDQVDKATTLADVTTAQTTAETKDTAVKEAKAAETKLNEAKDAAKATINATDLSNEEKANLLAQVDSATTLDTVAAVQTKATEAKDAETKLNDAKAAAKDQINALTDLTEADKNTLLDQVDKATTLADVTTAQTTAETKDTAVKEAKKLNDAKAAAKDQINALTDLAEADKNTLLDQVDKATTLADVTTAQTTAETKDTAVKEAKAAETKLNEAKDAAKATINATDLSNEEKANLLAQVDSATTLDTVAAVQTKATEAKDAETKLNDAKAAAKDQINALTDLTEADKNTLLDQVDKATTLADVTTAQTTAETKDTAVKEAKLNDAKVAAKDQINALTDLTEADKNTLLDQVDKATTLADVTTAQTTAETKDTAVKEAKAAETKLNEAKDAAKATINATDLSNEEKANLLAQVDSATTLDTVAAVQTKATEAKDAETKLNDAKAAAKDQINALTDLTEADKNTLLDQVDKATTLADVTTAQTTAETKDTAVKEAKLNDAKVAAKDQINALTDLTEADKNTLLDQVDKATTLADVTTAQTTAETKDTAVKEAKKLNDAKAAAKDQINALTDLAEADKNTLLDQVDKATTLADVTTAQTTAETKDTAVKEAKLNDAKVAAKDQINALTDLTEADKNTLLDQVDKATTLADVTTAQTTAETKDTAVKEAKAAETKLNEAKDAAKATINATDLSNEEKANLLAQVDSATTLDTVAAVQTKTTEAKDAETKLNDAKAAAKDQINALTDLTEADKNTLLDQVDKATTLADVTTTQNTAQTKDTAVKEAKLNDAKVAAKATINALTNLDAADKTNLLNQVEQATSMAAVALAQMTAEAKDAATQDTGNKLSIAKDAAKAAINAATLGVAEKALLLAQVDQANTLAEVTAVQNTLAAKDPGSQLDVVKAAAKATINTLVDLSLAEKATLLAQVEAATRPADVVKIQTNAVTLASENQILQMAKDLTNAKAMIATLPNLNAAEKEVFITQLDAANTPDEIATITAQALTITKETAKATINALPQLSTSEKNVFLDRVTAATTVDSIKKAEIDATKLAEENQLTLDKAKAKATINELADLNTSEKTTLLSQVDIAQTPQALANIQAEAQATAANNRLIAAKVDAKVAISALSDLNNEEKVSLLTQVDQATTPEQVAQVQTNAVTLANENQVLQAAKTLTNAKAVVSTLTDLSDEEKTAFMTRVNAATTADEIKQLIDTTTAKALTTAKAAAQAKINDLTDLSSEEKAIFNARVTAALDADGIMEAQLAATKLATENQLIFAKAEAQAAITALTGLSDEEKAALNKQVSVAATAMDVTKLQIDAAKLAGDHQALKAQQTIATTAIEALSDLNAAEKAAFINQIALATSPDEVIKIQNNATKAAAKAVINALKDLDDTQKATLLAQVDAAKTPEEIAQAQKTATILANENQVLQEAQTLNTAKTLISTLPGLNDEEKANLLDQVNAATTADEIKQMVDTIMSKVLNGTKADAKAKINALTDLSSGEKAIFTARVDVATTGDGIVKAQNDAIKLAAENALSLAKANAKIAINILHGLSEVERTTLADQIDAATTVYEVATIQAAAEAKAIGNSLETVNAATTAKLIISALTGLSDEEKTAFITQVNDATSAEAINFAKDTAVTKNNFIIVKKAAQADITALTELADEEKTAFMNQINMATTADLVASIRKEAIKRDNDSIIGKPKAEAIAKITRLTTLNSTELTEYINQINDATSGAQIDTITKAAEAKDYNYRLEEAKAEFISILRSSSANEDNINSAISYVENINDIEKLSTIKSMSSTDPAGFLIAMNSINPTKFLGAIDSVYTLYTSSDDFTKNIIIKLASSPSGLSQEEIDSIKNNKTMINAINTLANYYLAQSSASPASISSTKSRLGTAYGYATAGTSIYWLLIDLEVAKLLNVEFTTSTTISVYGYNYTYSNYADVTSTFNDHNYSHADMYNKQDSYSALMSELNKLYVANAKK